MKKKPKKNNTKKDMVSEIKEEFKRHTGVLIEQMQKEVKTVAEGHATIIRNLDNHGQKFDEHDQRLTRVEMVVTDTNKQVKEIKDKGTDHEKRITRLEEKVHT